MNLETAARAPLAASALPATPASEALRSTPVVAQDFAEGSPRFVGPLADLNALLVAGQPASVLAAWRAAFQRHGVDAPRHVQGDFAGAGTLPDGTRHFAVDRFAIRSLCWRVGTGGVQAAPRADAWPGAALNVQAVFDYLYFHVVPSLQTVFAGVHRLPPACSARVLPGSTQVDVHRHWQPQFEEHHPQPLAEAEARFRQLLAAGVQQHTGPGRVLGCFLSGGTDSSTVAGLLKQVSGSSRTFSIGFDQAGYDEMAYSRIAARHFGTEHHEYYITPADLVATIPQAAASTDQPFGNSSMVPAYHCARIAREAGVTHLLGGDGGDELFGGNTRYAKQRVFGVYDHLPGWLRRGALEPLLADNPLARALPGVKKAASYVQQARVPMPERMEGWNLLQRLGVAEVLDRDFLAQVDVLAPAAHQRGVWQQSVAPSLVNRMLAYDWRYTLAETDLPKVISATRLAGVPVGFPLLDDALVDFSLALPAHYKVRGLKLRWFFKQALRGFLPDEIIVKKKQGFGLPFGPWAVSDPALNALARDSVMGLAARGVLRQDFAQALFAKWLPEHPHYYGEMIWISMMLEQWLRAHAPQWRAN
jgi:asparagine synthase (glutamine-hydrolysing)